MKLERYEPNKLIEKYFILPFTCTKCGNKFAFERGAIRKKVITYYWGTTPTTEMQKFCYDCAEKEFEEEYSKEMGL